MRNKIYLGFIAVLLVFAGGSITAVYYITKAANRVDTLIMLHQVEILREDLVIRVQQVQSHLYRSRIQNGGDVDMLIAQVQEMDRVMDSCMGCHHTPELTQGLKGMRDTANDYKNAISRIVTASGSPDRVAAVERRAQEIGQELIAMTQGMAFTANTGLQLKTRAMMSTIREIKYILYLTLALGILLTGIAAYLLNRGLEKRLRMVLEAARRVARGEFSARLDIGDERDPEFVELTKAWNALIRGLGRSQRQMVQSAKLAAIRDVATTIAYEISNPLTGVHGAADLLLRADDISPDRKEHLKTIERETLRAREILRSLLEFSRRKPPRLVKTDLATVIKAAISQAETQANRSHGEIIVDCPSEFPPVAMDADEMKQAIMNLINNAFLAMPDGGTLTIRCRQSEDYSGKDVVAVDIIDTGRGMSEGQLDKVFDPFFTARSGGEGAGLGLSLSYLIVHNHGGRIDVESTVGVGSTFTVILPISL